MRHRLFFLLFILAMLSPAPGGVNSDEIRNPGLESRPASSASPLFSAQIVTQPGYRYALGDGFEVGPDGLVRVIVTLSDEPAAETQLLASLGPTVHVHRRFARLFPGMALHLDPAALAAMRDHPSVYMVYPDTRMEASLGDSVPLVGAPQVWALSDDWGRPVTGQGIRVAIVDSGVDYTHAALGGCFGSGCKVVDGYDFVNEDEDPLDDHGHGTHVAGIVAADLTPSGPASRGASAGLQGVAPDAELLAYKVFDENAVGYASDVIAALERSVDDGAHVINLSLGAPGTPDDPVSLAAQAAVEAGCVVVAAAGNGGPRAGTVEAPSIAPDVISVAAAGKDDVVADFSSRGPVPHTFALKPDLTAPGVAISSTVPLTGAVSDPSGWLPVSGTSMAAPHVAGGAALLQQLHPGWTPLEIKAALMNYALDLQIDLSAQGAGRLDLFAAATADLLAVPGSLSFGLPLLDGTDALTLAVRNLSTATLMVTPTVSVAHVADGTGQPISPTLPVTYASAMPSSVSLPPSAARIITVTVDVPLDAADGHYQGRVHLQAQGSEQQATVPLGFSLLSRVTLRVMDEAGDEITGWGHMAVLARVSEADFVVSNIPLQVPVTFTVPSGDYYAQGFGRFGLYDHLLIPGVLSQVPYAIVQPETIAPHAVQTITLDLADTRPYWLDATDVDGNPTFVNAWAASFRHTGGDAAFRQYLRPTWLTRLGQSYVRVLSTDLPTDWPAGFPVLVSDTPPDVAFNLSLQGVSFSPAYRDFVSRHGSLWHADPTGGFGFPLTGSADRAEYLAWDRPVLDASTPPTFTVSVADVARFTIRTDVPGLLEAPWLGWETAAEGWLYPPTGAGSGLEPVSPGLTRTLAVAGAHHALYWAGDLAQYRIFHRSFYTPDWSQTYAWDLDPNVLFPEEVALQALPPGQDDLTLGAGPLYPSLVFDNQADAVQMRHPLLAGETGSPLAWSSKAPAYALTLDSMPVISGTLPEYNWIPLPLRRWPDLPPGAYEMVITPTTDSAGEVRLDSAQVEPGIIRAGFSLTGEVGADLDPPQVLDFTMPQRFDPTAALTAAWILSDAHPVSLDAVVRLGDAPWMPLAVEWLGNGHYQARIEPGGAPTVSLTYTATDDAGNWLSWQAKKGATALAQLPVTLTFELDPPGVPWSQQPATVHIVGTLLGPGGQPLADTPAWLRLRAGGDFVGYVRDLTGSPGNYHTGDIGFAWTFVPAERFGALSLTQDEQSRAMSVTLEFDVGLYAPQKVTRMLRFEPPLYLPVIIKGHVP